MAELSETEKVLAEHEGDGWLCSCGTWARGEGMGTHRAHLAAVLDAHWAEQVERVNTLADWYDAQPNWRPWHIGASIRAALARPADRTTEGEHG